MSRITAGITLIFIGFIIFEIAIYASVKEKLAEFEQSVFLIKVEIEELQKTQRLIAQDADMAMRFVIESGVTDDKKTTD